MAFNYHIIFMRCLGKSCRQSAARRKTKIYIELTQVIGSRIILTSGHIYYFQHRQPRGKRCDYLGYPSSNSRGYINMKSQHVDNFYNP